MIVLLELLAVWLVVTTLAYVLLSVYFRSVQREELEKEYDAGVLPGSRDDYVEQGMETYKHSLRRRLIVLVYALPAVFFFGVIYIVNYS